MKRIKDWIMNLNTCKSKAKEYAEGNEDATNYQNEYFKPFQNIV